MRSTTDRSRIRASRRGTRPPRPCSTRGWATDGSGHPSGTNTGVGKWQPLINPANGQPILDPTPWVGGVKPFLIQARPSSVSALPPALGSAQWAAEFNEVKSLGRADSTTRTDRPDVCRQVVAKRTRSELERSRPQLIARNDLDAADAARLLALLNLSGADAGINCWNDKYHFDFWRPWNAITTSLDDGNAGHHDRPVVDRAHHRAVSRVDLGHNCLDAAEVTALRLFFGDAPRQLPDHEHLRKSGRVRGAHV